MPCAGDFENFGTLTMIPTGNEMLSEALNKDEIKIEVETSE